MAVAVADRSEPSPLSVQRSCAVRAVLRKGERQSVQRNVSEAFDLFICLLDTRPPYRYEFAWEGRSECVTLEKFLKRMLTPVQVGSTTQSTQLKARRPVVWGQDTEDTE